MKRKSSQLGQKCARVKGGDGPVPSRCTIQQAVRFVLERQGLVQRFHIAPLESKKGQGESKSKRTAERKFPPEQQQLQLPSFEPLMPLHATAQTTPPLSLLARVHQFQEQHLGTFLAQSRQSPLHYPMLRCMRGTLHLVPASKHSLVTGLYNFDGARAAHYKLEQFGMTSSEFQYLSAKIIRILSSKGPMTTQSLSKMMEAEDKPSTKFRVRRLRMQSAQSDVTESNVSIALHALFGQAQVHHGLASTASSASPSSNILPLESWRDTRRLHGIAALASTSSTVGRNEEENEEGEEEKIRLLANLMRWYFELYSPASLQDFIWWSGHKVGESRAALTTLLTRQEVKEVYVQGLSSSSTASTASSLSRSCVCFVWAAHEERLLATEDSLPRGVRFLPYEDAIIKAYKETRHRFYFLQSSPATLTQKGKGKKIRTEVVANVPSKREEEEMVCSNEILQELAFGSGRLKGEANPTLWIDGQIAGCWNWKNVKKSTTKVTTKTKTRKDEEASTSSPVITITTEQAVSREVLSRLEDELAVLCDLLDCCPRRDVKFLEHNHK